MELGLMWVLPMVKPLSALSNTNEGGISCCLDSDTLAVVVDDLVLVSSKKVEDTMGE
jgi:hypothetical protein